MLARLNADLVQAGYFTKYNTEMLLLDAEIIPWNLKARELIATQYAHVAEAAKMDREHLLTKLQQAEAAGRDVSGWVQEMEAKLHNVQVFRQAFQQYCWDVSGLEGIRIAPFHVLAHSGQSFLTTAISGIWSRPVCWPEFRRCSWRQSTG